MWSGTPRTRTVFRSAHRDAIPLYGSGGFCSYADTRLTSQHGWWAAHGFGLVKMKVGRDPAIDAHRVDVARAAIGPDVELFVDANGHVDRGTGLVLLSSKLRCEPRGPSSSRPSVDPVEVPLPAKMTPNQARKFAEPLLRGQPDWVAIATNAIGGKIREMV